jgi:hypothetical protein
MKITRFKIKSNWKLGLPEFYPILIAFSLLFSCWLMFHTFSYDPIKHEIKIAFKLWSDFGAHIPLIRSFSMGDNLDRITRGLMPEYPIFPGEPIRYHFLFYLFVGILERIGLQIDWALNIPSILGLFFMMAAIIFISQTLFKSKMVALLSILFFIFNGSLGFLRFFQLNPLSLQSYLDVIKAKDFPAFAPWGPGEISAFWNLNIYTNQRHLAFAFALVLLFILTCLRLETTSFKKQASWALLWGIVFGFLPYFHQPALLIVAVIMATYMLAFPKLRLFLLTSGFITTALVIPQILAARGAGSPAEWFPGYIIHNEIVKEKGIQAILHMASFWWQNMGLHSILIPIGFFIIPKRARITLLPIIPLFIIPNLFKFSIEVSANHKFFNFILIMGNMISAYTLTTLISIARKTKQVALVGFAYLVVISAVGFMTLTGIIDFFVVVNDTKGTVVDIPANQTATWISENTPKTAYFLNSNYLYHPASMAGRFIFLGWPYFAWSAGYKTNRMPIMDSLYESRDPKAFCELLKKHHITHVSAEDVKNDTNLPDINLSYYLKTYKPIFVSRNDKYAIFQTSDICQAK